MIRTLIIDDVTLARQRLKRCLAGDPEIEIVGECDNGAKAVTAIRSLSPDLIFLDVQMPALDGFGVLDSLKNERVPAVILRLSLLPLAQLLLQEHRREFAQPLAL